MFQGHFENDKRNGKGLYFYAYGDHNEGYFENDLRNGKDIYYLANDSIKYHGQWLNHKPINS